MSTYDIIFGVCLFGFMFLAFFGIMLYDNYSPNDCSHIDRSNCAWNIVGLIMILALSGYILFTRVLF